MWPCCPFAIPTSTLRWIGKDKKESKEYLCGEILRTIEGEGIRHRNRADVRTKIDSIIRDYNKAKDWLASSGAGTTEGGERTIRGKRTRPSASVLR
jgi:hypothetical protein